MGLVLLLSLATAGCGVYLPTRGAERGVPPRPAPGSLGEPAPPRRVARARPPRPPAPPRAVARPDDGPLTAKIVVDTPPGRAAALRLTEKARRVLAGGETARAIELLERAVAIDARVPYAYYFLGEAHYRAERPALAGPFLDRAEQLLASEPYWLGETRALRGLMSEREGRLAAARRAYRRALAAWPGNQRAVSGLARVDGVPEGVP